ncbi:MAG: NYN domain-containing protein, partial [Bacteroidota bacterium]
PNEKMTDVNIAVEMMNDAFQDRFDTALLVSADSDLTAPIKSIRSLFPNKRIVIAFPPQRHSLELTKQAHACFTLGRANLAKSMFPLEVQKSDGFILKCPDRWLNR